MITKLICESTGKYDKTRGSVEPVSMTNYGMSEWLLLNGNSAIVQLYHGENKLPVAGDSEY